MALVPGTRLGAYEIVGLIGAGGMGEVYRAIDTNLKRQVAIKILPTSVAGDTERLARFQCCCAELERTSMPPARKCGSRAQYLGSTLLR